MDPETRTALLNQLPAVVSASAALAGVFGGALMQQLLKTRSEYRQRRRDKLERLLDLAHSMSGTHFKLEEDKFYEIKQAWEASYRQLLTLTIMDLPELRPAAQILAQACAAHIVATENLLRVKTHEEYSLAFKFYGEMEENMRREWQQLLSVAEVLAKRLGTNRRAAPIPLPPAE